MKKQVEKKLAYIAEFGDTKLPTHSAKILPSLYEPVSTTADQATHVRPYDDVLGLTFNGITRAYPTWIMDNYHNVNDTFAGAHLLVVH